eukprot:365826-Chlamydomonas_euryale.AAC.2
MHPDVIIALSASSCARRAAWESSSGHAPLLPWSNCKHGNIRRLSQTSRWKPCSAPRSHRLVITWGWLS